MVISKSTSHSKINDVLWCACKCAAEPKEVGNLVNKHFVSIADDLIKQRMDVVCKYDEFCFDSVKNEFRKKRYQRKYWELKKNESK